MNPDDPSTLLPNLCPVPPQFTDDSLSHPESCLPRAYFVGRRRRAVLSTRVRDLKDPVISGRDHSFEISLPNVSGHLQRVRRLDSDRLVISHRSMSSYSIPKLHIHAIEANVTRGLFTHEVSPNETHSLTVCGRESVAVVGDIAGIQVWDCRNGRLLRRMSTPRTSRYCCCVGSREWNEEFYVVYDGDSLHRVSLDRLVDEFSDCDHSAFRDGFRNRGTNPMNRYSNDVRALSACPEFGLIGITSGYNSPSIRFHDIKSCSIVAHTPTSKGCWSSHFVPDKFAVVSGETGGAIQVHDLRLLSATLSHFQVHQPCSGALYWVYDIDRYSTDLFLSASEQSSIGLWTLDGKTVNSKWIDHEYNTPFTGLCCWPGPMDESEWRRVEEREDEEERLAFCILWLFDEERAGVGLFGGLDRIEIVDVDIRGEGNSLIVPKWFLDG